MPIDDAGTEHWLEITWSDKLQVTAKFNKGSLACQLQLAAGANTLSENRPMDLLGRSLKSQVLVKLKGDRELRGRLRGYDQHLNLILDDAEDLTEQPPQELGTVILRGDNVILLSPSIKSQGKKPAKKKK